MVLDYSQQYHMKWKGTFRGNDGINRTREKTFYGEDEADCREKGRLYVELMRKKGWHLVQGGFVDDYKDTIRRN